MGIPNLQHFNMCLLASWVSRYYLNDNVLWRKIVDFKHKTDKTNLFCCPEIGASPFWKGVLWACKVARWATRGGLAMVAKSVFGRTAGLATLVWQFSIGLFMLPLTRKGRL